MDTYSTIHSQAITHVTITRIGPVHGAAVRVDCTSIKRGAGSILDQMDTVHKQYSLCDADQVVAYYTFILITF